MKKIILLSLVVLLLLIPSTAFANGMVTITIAPDGLSFTVTNSSGDIPGSFEVTFCDGSIYIPVPWLFHYPSETLSFDKPISHVRVWFYAPPVPFLEASRNCKPIEGEPTEIEPLFMMWLLTRGDQGCILVSETHPSVERQRVLCFPTSDPDWTADNAPCADFVYSNGKWSCDTFGFSRLPLHSKTGPNLMKVWQRHIARQQE